MKNGPSPARAKGTNRKSTAAYQREDTRHLKRVHASIVRTKKPRRSGARFTRDFVSATHLQKIIRYARFTRNCKSFLQSSCIFWPAPGSAKAEARRRAFLTHPAGARMSPGLYIGLRNRYSRGEGADL